MYVRDGIAYAGEPAPVIKVSGVRPLSDHQLWIRFNTGEIKIFDFAPLLGQTAFAPLADEEVSGRFISTMGSQSGWTVISILRRRRSMRKDNLWKKRIVHDGAI